MTDPILAALTDLQDAAALILGRLTLTDSRTTRRLDRMELTLSAVDDKLDDLSGAVTDAADTLQELRDELANAGEPGDLSPDQAARFDNVIASLRSATAGPADVPPEGTPAPTPEQP